MGQAMNNVEMIYTVRHIQRTSRKLNRALVNMGRIASRYPDSCKRRVFVKWRNAVTKLQRKYDQLGLDLTYSNTSPLKWISPL